MKFANLQELSSLKDNLHSILESKASKDFAGIQRVVDDALGDLKDKLGKGGSLATVFKESGASKLDKTKDADGKNILKQIVDKTTAYSKEIEKLLLEAEFLVAQVNEAEELEGDVLLEANNSSYSDSSEFTEEFYSMAKQITDLKMKMKNQRWLEWFKSTDSNFATDSVTPARSAISSINSLSAQMGEIEDELDQADQG